VNAFDLWLMNAIRCAAGGQLNHFRIDDMDLYSQIQEVSDFRFVQDPFAQLIFNFAVRTR
jgi:hypothetical protein